MGATVRVLREKLGDAAMFELERFVDESKQDTLVVAAERFERRLGEEMAALRIDLAKESSAVRVDTARECAALRGDMAREFAAVRGEMAREFAAVRGEMATEFAAVRGEMANGFAAAKVELATTRAELLKWSFLFWIGQVAVVSAIMAFLLRTMGPR